MMVIGSFASYTKTKPVESAVWCLLTLDGGGEQVTINRIEIPEQGSGSELFFLFSNNNQKTKLNENEAKVEQRIILNE